MQFLQSSETIQLPNPLKLPELQLKFDDQIIGNHISKVPVFKISQGPSAQTPLDGLHLLFSTMPPPQSLHWLIQNATCCEIKGWGSQLDLEPSR